MGKDKVKFVKQALIFLVIVCVLILLFNQAYTDQVLTKTKKHRKEALYEEYIKSLPEKEIDLAFFGDSHVIFAINPEYIPNGFNYGVESEHYLITYYKIRNILFIEKLRLNTIILQIDMHTFSSYMIDPKYLTTDNLLQNERFMTLKELRRTYKKSVPELWLRTNFPVIGNGEDFFTASNVELATVSKMGFIRSEKNFSDPTKRGGNYTKEDFAKYRYTNQFMGKKRITPILLDAFEEVLYLAKQMDIDVVLIRYPVTKTYDNMTIEKNIDKENYYKTIFETADKVLGKGNYHVLDYYDYFFGRDDYMMDADHLNWGGAIILSKQIYKDLRELKLTKDTRKESVFDTFITA